MVSSHILAAGSAQDDPYLESWAPRRVLEATKGLDTGPCIQPEALALLIRPKMNYAGCNLSSLATVLLPTLPIHTPCIPVKFNRGNP